MFVNFTNNYNTWSSQRIVFFEIFNIFLYFSKNKKGDSWGVRRAKKDKKSCAEDCEMTTFARRHGGNTRCHASLAMLTVAVDTWLPMAKWPARNGSCDDGPDKKPSAQDMAVKHVSYSEWKKSQLILFLEGPHAGLKYFLYTYF